MVIVAEYFEFLGVTIFQRLFKLVIGRGVLSPDAPKLVSEAEGVDVRPQLELGSDAHGPRL